MTSNSILSKAAKSTANPIRNSLSAGKLLSAFLLTATALCLSLSLNNASAAEGFGEYRFSKDPVTKKEAPKFEAPKETVEAPKEEASKDETSKVEQPKDKSGWSAAISDGLIEDGLTDDQKALIIKINNYLNQLTDLKGRFVQVNPDDGQQKGKFYLKRPGRIRFDYAPPSLQVIVSNGEYLSIEDRDIDSVDRYPLEKTPFRILLAADVNIVRDAVIKGVIESDEQASIIMVDRKGEALGQIELTFDKTPELQIREWKVIDVQGRTTQVILSNLQIDEKIDGKLFNLETSSTPFFNP